MSLANSPPEVILLVSKSLSTESLSRLSRVSKRFSQLLRPVLYASISIVNTAGAQKLEEVSLSEDLEKFIKTVSILKEGKDQIQKDATREITRERERPSGKVASCTEKLFAGKFFDISGVSRLFVHNVEERCLEIPRPLGRLGYGSNLVELSVIAHAGGGRIWTKLLNRRYLPNLKRLTFVDVTEQTYTSAGTSIFNSCVEIVGPSLDYHELEVTEEVLEKSNIIDQLELLVCRPYPFLRNRSSTRPIHLSLLTDPRWQPYWDSHEYVMLYLGREIGGDYREQTPRPVKDALRRIWKAEKKEKRLIYLCLPPWFKQYDKSFPRDAGIENRPIIITYDGDLDKSIVPQSFIDHLLEEKLISRI